MNPGAQYQQMANAAAGQYGIDPGVFGRQINQESGWNPAARSPAGAIGIAQFMPATARGMGVNPLDPHSALYGAARYDAQLLHQFGGDYRLALAGYNAGGGNARHALAAYPETQHYVSAILGGRPTPARPAPLPVAADTQPQGSSVDQQMLQMALIDDGEDPMDAAAVSGAFDTPPPQDAPLAPHGLAHFGGMPVAAWIAPALQYAQQHGWGGKVTSGYRSAAQQAALVGHSGGNPVAAPGTSNHQFTDFPGGAVDVSQAAQLAHIIAGSPYGSQLVRAGAKDPVHFSFPHNGSY